MKTRLKMEDLLGELGEEQDQQKRDIDTESDPILDALCTGFEKFKEKECDNYHEAFAACRKCVPKGYTAKDIHKFCLALPGDKQSDKFGESAGVYLSELINKCPEKEVTLITHHLGGNLHGLGYRNKEHIIIVEGDVGADLGGNMSGGQIEVKGSAGDTVGFDMSKGNIVVHGDVGRELGYYMSGGKILVHGDAAKGLGRYMDAGEIHIQGRFRMTHGCFNEARGGNIYRKGIQIVKDGERV